MPVRLSTFAHLHNSLCQFVRPSTKQKYISGRTIRVGIIIIINIIIILIMGVAEGPSEVLD